MHTLNLRRYQAEALDHIDARLAAGDLRTAVVLPTGMGKTVVFSHLIARQLDAGRRVVVLVHRDELAEQAASKIRSVAPDATVGIVKAERNELDAQVLVCSVQTLARPARIEQINPASIGCVIVDECHHAVARTWTEVLAYFGCFFDANGDTTETGETIPTHRFLAATPAIGFTATMYREDGKGLGNIWQSVAYEQSIEWGIENGYLCDVRGQQVTVDGFDLAQIAKSRGDYREGQLGNALIDCGAGDVIAQAYMEHAGFLDARGAETYRRGVLFAPTVESAYSFAESMNEHGIRAATIVGETSKEDRALIYKQYEAGEIDVLTNAMVLTEGWDSPATEVAVIARPTQNPGLYTQMIGRVLRPFPGKAEALVLDVVGIAGQHRLQSLTTLTTVNVLDGESLSEAQERVAREHADLSEVQRIAKAHEAREVELFAASHSAWLQTKGGVRFIPVRMDGQAGSVVLWQSPQTGLWSVGIKLRSQAGQWKVRGVEFEYALSWGDQIANEIDPTVASKDRAWRRAKPSQAQLDLALNYHLAPADELVAMRRGAVSDLISTHFANRELKALER